LPREGFKSLTLPEDVYDYWFDEFKKNKSELRKYGVNSFSGYIVSKLYNR